jgi:hypothetical protein
VVLFSGDLDDGVHVDLAALGFSAGCSGAKTSGDGGAW